MVLFQGNNRVFDKVLSEDTDSTTTARKLTIYGVTDYSQITNVIFSVSTSLNGKAESTLNINSLGEKSIKACINGGYTNPEDNWVSASGVYSIMYNGLYFIIIGYTSTQSNTYSILDTVLDLTSSSTADEITSAFGSSDNISAFITAIQNNKIITVNGESDNIQYLVVYQEEKIVTTTDDSPSKGETTTGGTYYIINVIIDNADTSKQQNRRLTFTLDTDTGLFSSVTVTNTSINVDTELKSLLGYTVTNSQYLSHDILGNLIWVDVTTE